MRFVKLSIFGFISLVSSALAGDISLDLPIDCTLGETCYIQNYVDQDPTGVAADFTCGKLTYDGHKGTDFALPTLKDMWEKVDVLATAPGIVKGIRNHMQDHLQGIKGAPSFEKQDCGNGVVIDHGEGWVTQYCHMMKGSVTVKTGDRVNSGTVLGHVGISGNTQFPHLHLSVRKDGKVVDPFTPHTTASCHSNPNNSETLWADLPEFQSTGLLSIGITDGYFEYTSVKNGNTHEETLAPSNSEMLVYGLAFGGQPGDIMRLSLTGPNGIITKRDAPIPKYQALYARSVTQKNIQPWPTGKYHATVKILRNGIVIDEKTRQTVVMP